MSSLKCLEYVNISSILPNNLFLQDTLDKMHERIESAPWDADSDPQMMKRLKEIAGLSGP